MSQASDAASAEKSVNQPAGKSIVPTWLSRWIPLLQWATCILLTAGGWYLLYVWHAPDLHYETGGYYRTGSTAVAMLQLKNYGTVDAEEITISAHFTEPIEGEVSTNDDAVTFTPTSGGKGTKAVVGTVARLVPDQTVNIYYTVHNPQGPLPAVVAGEFISQITHKGGKGRLGPPWGWLTWGLLIGDVAMLGAMVLLVIIGNRGHRRFIAELRAMNEENDAKSKTMVADFKAEMAEYRERAQAERDAALRKAESRMDELKLEVQKGIAAVSSRDAVKALAEEIVAALRAPRPRQRASQSASPLPPSSPSSPPP